LSNRKRKYRNTVDPDQFLLVDSGGGAAGGGGSTEPVDSPPNPPANQAPMVNPGVNQTINLPADTVQLDGSKSFDPENGPLSFRWTLENGPTDPPIINADKAIATVAGLEEGNYGFRLTVTDGMGATDTGLVYITVQKAPTSAPASPADNTNTTTAPVLTFPPSPYETSTPPAKTADNVKPAKKLDLLFWCIIGVAAGYVIFAKND
jgi:hypothetical protein